MRLTDGGCSTTLPLVRGGNWANNPVWVGDASYGDQVEVNGAWDTCDGLHRN